MGELIRIQWRLVRASFFVWTAVSLAVAIPMSSGNFRFTSDEYPRAQLFLSVLAAAAAARLFTKETIAPPGAYFRQLPVSGFNWFLVKTGLGLLTILASFLICLAWWEWGAVAKLASAFYGREFQVLSPGAFEWRFSLAWALATFACTAYFANSFERLAASRQAGVPGLLVGFVWPVVLASLGPAWAGLGVWAALLAVSSGATWTAWRLFKRRGVGASSLQERVLGSPVPRDRFVLPVAQVALVALPLAGLVHWNLTSKVAPFVGWSAWQLGLCAALALGVTFLPWTLRQIELHGLRGPKAAGLFLLGLSGGGLWVWKAIRPKAPIVRCSACERVRSASVARCPTCGQQPALPIEASVRRFAPVPSTPWTILTACFVAWILAHVLLGGLRFGRELDIRAKSPDIEVALDGEAPHAGGIQRHFLGRTLGFPLGFVQAGDFHLIHLAEPRTSPLELAELARLAREEELKSTRDGPFAWDRGRPAADQYFWEFLEPQDHICVSYRGRPASVHLVSVNQWLSDFTCSLSIEIEASFPELEGVAREFVEESVKGPPSSDMLQRASFWGNLLTKCLERPPGVTPPDLEAFRSDWTPDAAKARLPAWRREWAALEAAMVELALVRFPRDDKDPGRISEQLWQEIETKFEGALTLGSGYGDYPIPVHSFQCQLRRLALAEHETAASILVRIEAGSPLACVVAGMSGNRRYYDACEALMKLNQRPDRHLDPEKQRRKLAAAWAMLELDPDRASNELLESIRVHPDVSLIPLLGFSANAEIEAHLSALSRATDHDLELLMPHADADLVRLKLRDALAGLSVGLVPAEYWRL